MSSTSTLIQWAKDCKPRGCTVSACSPKRKRSYKKRKSPKASKKRSPKASKKRKSPKAKRSCRKRRRSICKDECKPRVRTPRCAAPPRLRLF